MEYLVILKREVYTLDNWVNFMQIYRVGVNLIQSRDRKNLIEKWLERKVWCCIPKSAKSTKSGFVISPDATILPDAINAIVTGDVNNYMQLKAISRSISFDI